MSSQDESRELKPCPFCGGEVCIRLHGMVWHRYKPETPCPLADRGLNPRGWIFRTPSPELAELRGEVTRLQSFERGMAEIERGLGRSEEERERRGLVGHVALMRMALETEKVACGSIARKRDALKAALAAERAKARALAERSATLRDRGDALAEMAETIAHFLEDVAAREQEALDECKRRGIDVGEFSLNYPTEQLEQAEKIRTALAAYREEA